jgi:hypothetical protein
VWYKDQNIKKAIINSFCAPYVVIILPIVDSPGRGGTFPLSGGWSSRLENSIGGIGVLGCSGVVLLDIDIFLSVPNLSIADGRVPSIFRSSLTGIDNTVISELFTKEELSSPTVLTFPSTKVADTASTSFKNLTSLENLLTNQPRASNCFILAKNNS